MLFSIPTLHDCKKQDGTHDLNKLKQWAKANKIPVNLNPKNDNRIPRMEVRPNNRVLVQWTADHAFMLRTK